MDRPADTPPEGPPGARDLFKVFALIGLTSFGGGLSGWMMREIVQRRGWLTEADFLSGLALAQAFPGVNVVNLAIWLGFRLKGGQGALAAALGLVVPPMAVVLVLAGVFAQVTHVHAVHVALAGIAAAAVGLSLQTGLRAARARRVACCRLCSWLRPSWRSSYYACPCCGSWARLHRYPSPRPICGCVARPVRNGPRPS
ncbi:chromate transporter [Pigmentiphaga litoralis]|uniref:chromate transporter n=1 Tax=Pigmentiphaga litoralis TaxID=516702 RepID=UPI003B43A1C5